MISEELKSSLGNVHASPRAEGEVTRPEEVSSDAMVVVVNSASDELCQHIAALSGYSVREIVASLDGAVVRLLVVPTCHIKPTGEQGGLTPPRFPRKLRILLLPELRLRRMLVRLTS